MSWTVDETNQFMALLGKYPAEKSQTNRWRKIANELETKSAKQVASKAQKEFVKMRRIRKRIPGSQDPGKSLPTRADGNSELDNSLCGTDLCCLRTRSYPCWTKQSSRATTRTANRWETDSWGDAGEAGVYHDKQADHLLCLWVYNGHRCQI